MSEYRPGPASLHTRMVFERALAELPFCDKQDEADAHRGRLADISDDPGAADVRRGADVLVEHQEDTHPSLLRISGLRRISGLFEVVPGVHQIRGLAPRNVTAVESDGGRILIDPPASAELRASAVEILDRHLGPRPVVAALDSSSGPGDATGRTVVDGVAIDSLPVRDGRGSDVLRWFPDHGLLYAASSVRHSLPPLVDEGRLRDPLVWAKALHGVLVAHQDELAVIAGAHDWPTWGNARARQLVADHRDLLRYVHDETLRLGYQGHSAEEIVALLRLPPALESRWYARGYDSTIEAYVRLLHPRTGPDAAEPVPWQTSVPPEAAARFLSWAGGVGSAADQLSRSFDDGDYRWVAQAGELVLATEPGALDVRSVTTQAYEQLAYQEENLGRRRLFADRARMLATTGRVARGRAGFFCVAAADVEQLMDHLAVRAEGPRAARHTTRFRWDVTDSATSYVLSLHNGALFAAQGRGADVDVVISTRRAVLAEIACGHVDWRSSLQTGAARVEGDPQPIALFFDLLDRWHCPRHPQPPTSTNPDPRQERP